MKRKTGRAATRNGVKGRADWAKLAAMQDRDIKFTKDAPRTSPTDWANAVAHRGLPFPSRKALIALRWDEDVFAWFRTLLLRLARYFNTSADFWSSLQAAFVLKVAAATLGKKIEKAS